MVSLRPSGNDQGLEVGPDGVRPEVRLAATVGGGPWPGAWSPWPIAGPSPD